MENVLSFRLCKQLQCVVDSEVSVSMEAERQKRTLAQQSLNFWCKRNPIKFDFLIHIIECIFNTTFELRNHCFERLHLQKNLPLNLLFHSEWFYCTVQIKFIKSCDRLRITVRTAVSAGRHESRITVNRRCDNICTCAHECWVNNECIYAIIILRRHDEHTNYIFKHLDLYRQWMNGHLKMNTKQGNEIHIWNIRLHA